MRHSRTSTDARRPGPLAVAVVLGALAGWTTSSAGTDCIPRPEFLELEDEELAELPACPNEPGVFYSLGDHDDLVDRLAERLDRALTAEARAEVLEGQVHLLQERLSLRAYEVERVTLERDIAKIRRRGAWRRAFIPCAGLGISGEIIGDEAGEVRAPTISLIWPCVSLSPP